jgi:hypothetical protein
MDNKEWKRKNPIFKELREKLHNFRADDMITDVSAEMAGDYNNPQPTGREIVTFKMIGKFKGVTSTYAMGNQVIVKQFPNSTAALKAVREANRLTKARVKEEEVARQAALALVENKETGDGNDGQT